MLLSQWLRQFTQRFSSCGETGTHRVRPRLEVLEDRIVPTNITYNGGPTIPHVQVNNIIMGAQSLDPNALVQALVRDYLPLLGPYYGIGAGSLRSSINAAPLPGNPTDAQIQGFLVQEINSGAVPPPGPDQVYMLFLAPGQFVPDIGAGSYHGFLARFGMQPIYYGVVYGTPGQTAANASHELAEAVTDPDSSTGWIDLSQHGGDVGEVADIYELYPRSTFPLDGYQVSILSGPQGQKIQIIPNPSLNDIITLAIEVAETLAFQYVASIDPQFATYAQEATYVLNSNLYYGTPQGQTGMMLGQLVFNSFLSQQNGG